VTVLVSYRKLSDETWSPWRAMTVDEAAAWMRDVSLNTDLVIPGLRVQFAVTFVEDDDGRAEE
jgi:hypothetical protein